jgi:L-fuconolactonase
MGDRTLVDTHLHLLDPARLRYPWLQDEPQIDAPHLPTDVVSAFAPRFVVVQAGTVPEDGLDEARWIDELAGRGHPEIAAVVAFAPIERGSAVAADLASVLTIPRVRGIRRLLQDEDAAFFADPAVRRGLAEVGRAGLAFDACVRWWQLPALADLLGAEPDQPVVLDHLGKPPVTEALDGQHGREWLEGIRRLASFPRVHVKLSGLPAEATDATARPGSLGPWLRAAVEAFGVDRCMVGSDWPVSRGRALDLGYDDWIELVLAELDLSPRETDRLLTGTATEFYGLDR